MKMRKVISTFLVLICLFAAFGLCTLGVSAAEGAKTVCATTSTSVKQGSYGYLYVYLDDLTDLSALGVSVYYDTEKITVKSVYNQVPSVVNDLATGDGCVNASYIFDGKGSAAKTNLFYIYYQVNSSAEVGETYFDIVVNEAFDSALAPMDFTGSRCAFEITEKTVSKSCTISSTSNVSASVGEEFELSYRLSTYQIASGSMNLQYDPELFEVVSVTNGGFLDGKIADVNAALDGAVSISFVGTTYQSNYDVITVRFKTLKNVTEASDIKLIVSELYDKELNLYACSGFTTNANIVFDETYTENAPSMSVSSSYNAETGKVTATIKLEKDSMLGAGDFTLKFDTRYLTFVSAQKEFSPTFFNINDKDAADGVLKFSIISLSDITEEQIVLTVVFDAKHHCQNKNADFEISGSGLTDSLVNTIQLNFVDSSVTIPLKHIEAVAVEENRMNPTCTVNGSYDSVVYCSVCNAELSREIKSIDKLGHNYSDEWTTDLAPTCTTAGSKSHHCTRCEDKTDVTTIPATGHTYGDWYVIKAPTCTATGTDEHKCSVCQHTETKTTNALGHTEKVAVVENHVEPTCTVNGSYDSVVYCSVCNAELSRERKPIDKLGHDHATEWTVDVEPTCTTTGSKSHHCTRCEDKADVTTIPATGHAYGDWYVIKAPTCTATGTDEHKCSVCQHTETKTTNALGHDYSTEWTTDIEPTCTTTGSKSHHCSRCTDKADVTVIPATGHSYGDWYITKHSTESEQGEKRRDCSNCDDHETSAIAVLDHSHDRWEAVVLEGKNPTCTLSGLTQGSKCSKCNEILISQNYIPAKGHAYDDWYETKAPTCNATGTQERKCSACHDTETQTVEALGHSYFTEWTTDLAPTCTTAGSKSHHCTRCGDKADVTTIPATGHTYGDWYVIKAPTCTATGTDEHKCSVCQHTETKTTNALGHTEKVAVVENHVEPTCTVNGSYDSVVYCSVCNAELSREIKSIDKLGHNYSDEWTTDLAPTCTTAGSKSHHCTRCEDKTDVTSIPATGHAYGNWYVIKAPTCTATGTDEHKCSVCQHTETKTTNALGHTEKVAVVENHVEPTCTVNGSYDSVVYCSVCNAELSRDGKSIDKLGHDMGTWSTVITATCAKDGQQRRDCSRCDHYETCPINATGHSHTTVVTDPTCTEKGYTTHSCHCGDSYADSYVDALGHKYTDYISDGNATTEADGTKTALCDNGCGTKDTVADEGSKLIISTITSDAFAVADGYISKISANTNISQLLSRLHGDSFQVLKDGKVIADDVLIGTGMVVRLVNEDTVLDEVTVIVTGDTNGDGKITITDMIAVKSHVLKKSTLSGAAAKAADTSGDNAISITDFIQLKAQILGKSNIEPKAVAATVQQASSTSAKAESTSNAVAAVAENTSHQESNVVSMIYSNQIVAVLPEKKVLAFAV